MILIILCITATTATLGFLPFSINLSANLNIGLQHFLLTSAGINKTVLRFFDPVFEMDPRPLTLDPDARKPGFNPANAANCLEHLRSVLNQQEWQATQRL